MENKKFETILYSGAGVVVMFIAIVAFNVISGAAKVRIDFTENNIYTLSDGTRRILEKLDTPVEIRFFASKGESEMPMQFKSYARRVEDILDEMKAIGGDNLRIQKYDPQPDSDAEDLANLDGVEGRALDAFGLTRIYLGISVSMLDSKVAIPFLSPQREKLLEYDLARAITSVTSNKKPMIGVISSLPVMGAPSNPMMQQMGQPGSEPWVFISELQKDFEVRDIGTSLEAIDDDIDVVMIIHPKALSEQTEYAIDQFIMRGGNVLAMLDPVSLTDTSGQGNNPMQRAMQAGSNLERLLPAWGFGFDPAQVVADMTYLATVQGQGGRPQRQPAVLALNGEAINRDDVVTSQIDNLTMIFAGTFIGEPVEGLTREVLVHTSEDSQLVQGFMAQMSGEQIIKEFKAGEKELPLAMRLTGNFKSAFPEGAPGSEPAEEIAESTPTSTHLSESGGKGIVLLLGDSDFIYDQFAAQVQNFMGQRIVMPRGGNLSFGQSLVEQLAGDSDLIAVRSRASMERPFTLIREMQSKAQDEYQAELDKLEEKLQSTQQRLSELQSMKDQGQQYIMSPEQQAEVQKFREQRSEVNKELKLMRRNLRKDVNSLETSLKWINILLMPTIVVIVGLTIATIKRKKTAAR